MVSAPTQVTQVGVGQVRLEAAARLVRGGHKVLAGCGRIGQCERRVVLRVDLRLGGEFAVERGHGGDGFGGIVASLVAARAGKLLRPIFCKVLYI